MKTKKKSNKNLSKTAAIKSKSKSKRMNWMKFIMKITGLKQKVSMKTRK